MDLKDYRAQLDTIDDQMTALFKQRMEIVRHVADYKKETNTPVMASGREREILYRVTGLCGQELEEYTKILYSTILAVSYTHLDVYKRQEHALCDGPQSLRPEKFADMMDKIRAIRPYADRSFTTGQLVLE